MPLTNIAVKNAKPGVPPVRQEQNGKALRPVQPGKGGSGASDRDQEEPKPYRMFDGGGLYLEVAPSGGKWWRWKYRVAGKEKRLSLGVYPEVSLAKAREERDECRKVLARGIDPAEQRKARKMAREGQPADSFEVVAREWLQKFIDPMSQSHSKRVHARFVNDIFPRIGARSITEITPKELLEVVLRIEKRGSKDTAHRTLGSCSQVFRYAISTGRCKSDITRDLRGALAPAEAGHFAAVTKPEKLAGILRGIDDYNTSSCGLLILICRRRRGNSSARQFFAPESVSPRSWSRSTTIGIRYLPTGISGCRTAMRRRSITPSAILIVPLAEWPSRRCGHEYSMASARPARPRRVVLAAPGKLAC